MKRKFCLIAILASTVNLFASDSCCIASRTEINPPSRWNRDFHYWVDASFTFWRAQEDGLNAAESAQVDGTGTTIFASQPSIFKQNFSFNPGFEVSIGLSSCNDWIVYGEYTYYRGTNHVSRGAPAGSTGTGVWNLDSWFTQKTFYSNQSLTGTDLSSTWKLAMDMGDLLLSRPMPEEAGFVYAPFGGLRTVWIRQQMNLELTEEGLSFGGDNFLGPQPIYSYNQSHTWGIGPRLGVEGRYNLPMGFGLNGTIGATLFYTRFSDIQHSEAAAANFYVAPAPLKTAYNCVRPELDLSLGFSWHRNIRDQQSIELVASYDLAYFWAQNMMRSILDECFAGTSSGGLDLYFQGLTIKGVYKY